MEINDYSSLVGILKAGVLVFGSVYAGLLIFMCICLLRITLALEKANGDR